MQKKLLRKFNTIYDKNSPESEHRGNLPQHNKGHITTDPQQTSFSMVKN